VSGYVLEGPGSILGRAKIVLFSTEHPDWFWGPPRPLSNGTGSAAGWG
jgi:hypothetical protein